MEANEAMKAMADRIADKMYPRTHPGWIGGQHCALAAIMETQEATASWLEQYPSPMNDLDMAMRIRQICAAIRTGEHYALAGDRHG